MLVLACTNVFRVNTNIGQQMRNTMHLPHLTAVQLILPDFEDHASTEGVPAKRVSTIILKIEGVSAMLKVTWHMWRICMTSHDMM